MEETQALFHVSCDTLSFLKDVVHNVFWVFVMSYTETESVPGGDKGCPYCPRSLFLLLVRSNMTVDHNKEYTWRRHKLYFMLVVNSQETLFITCPGSL